MKQKVKQEMKQKAKQEMNNNKMTKVQTSLNSLRVEWLIR